MSVRSTSAESIDSSPSSCSSRCGPFDDFGWNANVLEVDLGIRILKVHLRQYLASFETSNDLYDRG